MSIQNQTFPYAGAIDADGHILEPPDTWEKYIDRQFRDRALRIRPNHDGLEVVEVGGAPAKYVRPGGLAISGAMGKTGEDLEPHPDKTYVGQAPFGSMVPTERLERMDQEGLDKAIIMDAVYDSPLGESVPLKEKPSYYFHRQCWISGDPDEKAFGNVVDFVGADKFFWASDFPHFDHPGNYMDELKELVEPMSASTRQKVIGDNVAQVYGI